jgi:hypothetical protein
MSDSTIKYAFVVLLFCIVSVFLPKSTPDLTTHQTLETQQQFRPIHVAVPVDNEMVQHWGKRVRS